MSIWSSRLTLEPLRAPAYRLLDGEILPDSYLDVATARDYYNGEGLRICFEVPDDECAVLDRQQVTDLRDCLTDWLTATAGDTTPGAT